MLHVYIFIIYTVLLGMVEARSVYVKNTITKSKDQPGKVANPARGQLNWENDFFPVSGRAWEYGLARRIRQSRPMSACSSPYSG